MVQKKQKSAVAYALLALFLGWLGIHKFYAGKVGMGLLMLFLFLGGLVSAVVSVMFALAYEPELSGVFGFIGTTLCWGVGIWAFVDMIIGFCHVKDPQKLFK